MQRSGPKSLRRNVRRAVVSQPFNWAATSMARPLLTRVLPRRWLTRYLPKRGAVTLKLPSGQRARFWSRGDDFVTSSIWWIGTYEPEASAVFLRFATEASVVLDVGAYTGFYSILAATANPAARVFAFEPHPRIAARLGRNLDLNRHLTVTVLPYAVGNERRHADFHLGGPGLPTSSSLSPAFVSGLSSPAFDGRSHSIPVAVTDLDSFARDWGLETVDLIKIDVESTEDEVVLGTTEILKRHRPVFFMEVLPIEDRSELSTVLREMEYVFYHLTFDQPIKESELSTPGPYIDVFRTPVNHLACPAEKVPPWLEASPYQSISPVADPADASRM